MTTVAAWPYPPNGNSRAERGRRIQDASAYRAVLELPGGHLVAAIIATAESADGEALHRLAEASNEVAWDRDTTVYAHVWRSVNWEKWGLVRDALVRFCPTPRPGVEFWEARGQTRGIRDAMWAAVLGEHGGPFWAPPKIIERLREPWTSVFGGPA